MGRAVDINSKKGCDFPSSDVFSKDREAIDHLYFTSEDYHLKSTNTLQTDYDDGMEDLIDKSKIRSRSVPFKSGHEEVDGRNQYEDKKMEEVSLPDEVDCKYAEIPDSPTLNHIYFDSPLNDEEGYMVPNAEAVLNKTFLDITTKDTKAVYEEVDNFEPRPPRNVNAHTITNIRIHDPKQGRRLRLFESDPAHLFWYL